MLNRYFFQHNNIKSVVDLGCGDFLIGEEIYKDLKINYTGYDAYKELIDYHNKKYKPYNSKKENLYKITNNTGKKAGIIILNPTLKDMTFNFIHSDFTSNPEQLNRADLCIIKDVLQHLPNCLIVQFMNYITQSNKFKYILIINCWITINDKNTTTERQDIEPGGFSSLSALRYPLNKYGGRVIYGWYSKEVSLITL